MLEKQLKAKQMMENMEKNTYHIKVENTYLMANGQLTENYNFAGCFEKEEIDMYCKHAERVFPESKVVITTMYTAKRKEQMKGSVTV